MLVSFALPLPLLLLALASYVSAQSATPPPISATDDAPPPSSSTSPSTSQSASNSSQSGTTTASADFPSLTGLSQCATNCLQLAIAEDGCISITEVDCYCSPKANATRFANTLVACVSQECTDSADLASAESIAQQFCAKASANTSISFPTSVPSTSFSSPFTSTNSSSSSTSASASGNGSSTATTPAPSSTDPPSGQGGGNGAVAMGAPNVQAAAVGGVLGLVGAMLGLLV
ncbi:hypothetical protein C8Q80DRAFT_1214395 [Daedaleopsis nitida]|nr:hypothetical protein C8Q80DRAFT_1214395 [Daedaleopsis nitida]